MRDGTGYHRTRGLNDVGDDPEVPMGDAREREHVVVGERITRAYLPSCILQRLEWASVL